MAEFKSFYDEGFCAELAKSGRSECKICKKPIEQDTLRIGHTVYFDEEYTHINKKWMHLACVVLPANFKNIKVVDFEGIEDLDEKIHKQIRDKLKIPEGDMKSRKLPKKKVVVKNFQKVEQFGQQTALNKKEWAAYQAASKKYGKLKVEQMKELLQKNGASTSGAKDALANRCGLASVIGVHPNCPSCGGQNLRFYLSDGSYYCPGYLDDTDWTNCKTWFKFDEVKRTPWSD